MAWYAVSGAVVGLFLVFSYVTANLLFALIVLLTTLVIFIRHSLEAPMIDCTINRIGIKVGSKIYPFEHVRHFWIIERNGDRDVLYIEEKRGLRSIIPLPIYEHSSQSLREFLQKFVEEQPDRLFEPFWEWVGRRLKI